jgi:hypothetical protein
LCPSSLLYGDVPPPPLALCDILIFYCVICAYLLHRDYFVLRLSLSSWNCPWDHWHFPFLKPLLDLHMYILHCHAVN